MLNKYIKCSVWRLALRYDIYMSLGFKRLKAELNPICHFLALLEAHHILHISRIRVKWRSCQKSGNFLDKHRTYVKQFGGHNMVPLQDLRVQNVLKVNSAVCMRYRRYAVTFVLPYEYPEDPQFIISLGELLIALRYCRLNY